MRILVGPRFVKQGGRLDAKIKQRVNTAVQTIAEPPDPASLGTRKNVRHVILGCPKCVTYAYEINRSYRILYCVGKECLAFVRVGDHKTVYGKG